MPVIRLSIRVVVPRLAARKNKSIPVAHTQHPSPAGGADVSKKHLGRRSGWRCKPPGIYLSNWPPALMQYALAAIIFILFSISFCCGEYLAMLRSVRPCAATTGLPACLREIGLQPLCSMRWQLLFLFLSAYLSVGRTTQQCSGQCVHALPQLSGHFACVKLASSPYAVCARSY